MRAALILDEDARARIKTVKDYSEIKDNWYNIMNASQTPGFQKEHICVLTGGLRCVFSISTSPKSPKEPFRHLSVSVPGNKVPHPIVVWFIADLFGFTGWSMGEENPPKDWSCRANRDEGCIVVIQRYEQLYLN